MDVADITETAYGSESTDGEVETVTCTLRLAGETEGADQRDAEMWGHYGLAYRPAAPDGEHKCQALYDDIAGGRAVLATRDTRAADAAGALNPGDVALWSVGKVSVRCNADGSYAVLKQGETADSYHICEADGSWKTGNQWGQYELGPEGFKVILATGQALSLTEKGFTVVAPNANLACGSVCLGVGAAVPLCVVPTIVPTGTASPGFVSAKPVANVFV